MLSPSSKAAVAFEVNYTLGLLERFPADGVYLDDNQLGGNASDPGAPRPCGSADGAPARHGHPNVEMAAC